MKSTCLKYKTIHKVTHFIILTHAYFHHKTFLTFSKSSNTSIKCSRQSFFNNQLKNLQQHPNLHNHHAQKNTKSTISIFITIYPPKAKHSKTAPKIYSRPRLDAFLRPSFELFIPAKSPVQKKRNGANRKFATRPPSKSRASFEFV